MELKDLNERFLDFVSLCTHIDEKRLDLLQAAEIRKKWLLDRSRRDSKYKLQQIKESPSASSIVFQ
ncbi:MAG: hypothetical protein AMJ73_06545 [candidate division Zixibacteria bacterium SM1_73]|nr:MAG: hypothetical protein AMJ73_06545 [candidate division Zixibacteria bacterium SM1_73]